MQAFGCADACWRTQTRDARVWLIRKRSQVRVLDRPSREHWDSRSRQAATPREAGTSASRAARIEGLGGPLATAEVGDHMRIRGQRTPAQTRLPHPGAQPACLPLQDLPGASFVGRRLSGAARRPVLARRTKRTCDAETARRCGSSPSAHRDGVPARRRVTQRSGASSRRTIARIRAGPLCVAPTDRRRCIYT